MGFFAAVYRVHWPLTAALLVALFWMMSRWYSKDELGQWVQATWGFAKQITPLLLGGILVSGWLMGRPGLDAGLVPSSWVAGVVGGNSLGANFLASVVGALMYFATLTEVPILQTLLGSGMGQGPALALLLAGPALSLPSMLVINSYLGPRKTATYVVLVVVMATATGWLYGALAGMARREGLMTTVTVFRHAPPPLIGVCGVVPDRVSEAFEQNLDWLEANGFLVERLDPYREADAAARFPEVAAIFARERERCLPLVLVDGELVSSGHHPTRTELARMVGQHRADLVAAR